MTIERRQDGHATADNSRCDFGVSNTYRSVMNSTHAGRWRYERPKGEGDQLPRQILSPNNIKAGRGPHNAREANARSHQWGSINPAERVGIDLQHAHGEDCRDAYFTALGHLQCRYAEQGNQKHQNIRDYVDKRRRNNHRREAKATSRDMRFPHFALRNAKKEGGKEI